MTKLELKGLHKVKKPMSDGSIREYHRAWRGKGAPTFWHSGMSTVVGSADYIAALAAATSSRTMTKGIFRGILLDYLDSQDFTRLAPRSQSDIKIRSTTRRPASMPSTGQLLWRPSVTRASGATF